jgi:hypothetical protein
MLPLIRAWLMLTFSWFCQLLQNVITQNSMCLAIEKRHLLSIRLFQFQEEMAFLYNRYSWYTLDTHTHAWFGGIKQLRERLVTMVGNFLREVIMLCGREAAYLSNGATLTAFIMNTGQIQYVYLDLYRLKNEMSCHLCNSLLKAIYWERLTSIKWVDVHKINHSQTLFGNNGSLTKSGSLPTRSPVVKAFTGHCIS